MSSKFYGLKGKLNKINKEVTSKAVEKAEAAAAVEESSVTDHNEIVSLLESLNDSDTLDKAEAAVALPEVVVGVLAEVTDAPVRNPMSHIAYNIYWDDVERAYGLCTIEYNLSQNTAKIVETKRIADNPSVSLHKLNGLIALKLLKKEEVY